MLINALRPFTTLQYGMSTATAGDKLAFLDYVDGATSLFFIYLRRSTGTEFFRMLEIK